MSAELAPELTFEQDAYDLPTETYSSRLRLVDQAILDATVLAGSIGERSWLSADELPSIRQDRLSCDADSHSILADRMHLLHGDRPQEVPYAFNVLTTAYKLLDAEKQYGIQSPEYAQQYKGLHLDVTRHIAEANRRLTSIYVPEIEQVYDAEIDSYTYGGYVLDEVVTTGLTPLGVAQSGIDVLLADRREEFTAKSVGKLGHLMLEHSGIEQPDQHIRMFTVSQLDHSPQTVIRAMRFDPKHNRRFQEQIGFPKDQYITHEDIITVLKEKKAIARDAQPTETELIGVQVISLAGESVLDFQQLLDTAASKRTSRNIFMGRAVSDDHPKDYSAVPAEAAEHELEERTEAEALLGKVIDLARENTDGWHANTLVDRFVTDMLLDKVSENPEAARNIFGEKVARTIERSMERRELGDVDGAKRYLDEVRDEAPLATVCNGDGSCGIKSVDATDNKALAAAARLFGKKDIAGLLRDLVRSCPSCGQREIYYDTADGKADKGCNGCGETIIGGKHSKKQQKDAVVLSFMQKLAAKEAEKAQQRQN